MKSLFGVQFADASCSTSLEPEQLRNVEKTSRPLSITTPHHGRKKGILIRRTAFPHIPHYSKVVTGKGVPGLRPSYLL